MISYSEKFISDYEFTACLSFNPLEYPAFIHKTLTLTLTYNNEKKLLSKVNQYYNCAQECFEIYPKDLPLLKFDYYSSCMCVQECYFQLDKGLFNEKHKESNEKY